MSASSAPLVDKASGLADAHWSEARVTATSLRRLNDDSSRPGDACHLVSPLKFAALSDSDLGQENLLF